MSWQHRKPEGVGDVELTPDGFTAPVSIPLDEDGYFGRDCPSCKGVFKMRKDEWDALPDGVELTCPYCGHRDEHSAFISEAQLNRVRAAAHGLARQFVHEKLNDIFGKSFGSGSGRSSGSGSFLSVEVHYKPGAPPPIESLPEIAEKATRRVVACSACGNRHAVYSATAFCPVCGPRPATETVLEAIQAARDSLALEDRLPEEDRETLRAAGVFERAAVEALKSVVSLFEQFMGEQFEKRVAGAAALTAGKGNVFQRLDDAAQLFADHGGLDLPALAGADRWQRLRRTFAQRHVLTHNGGIVDGKFLAQVPDSSLTVGQRLVISRDDADRALNDLEAIVQAVSSAP